jgi:hypothetical protein
MRSLDHSTYAKSNRPRGSYCICRSLSEICGSGIAARNLLMQGICATEGLRGVMCRASQPPPPKHLDDTPNHSCGFRSIQSNPPGSYSHKYVCIHPCVQLRHGKECGMQTHAPEFIWSSTAAHVQRECYLCPWILKELGSTVAGNFRGAPAAQPFEG